MIKTFAMFRPFVFVLAMAAQCMASAQQYKNEPRYDTLNTRHDKSRSLVERFFLTANHGWACFNRGLKEEGRATCKEQLDLAEQIGVDSLLSIAYDDLSSAFSGSADAALQLKYAFRALEYAKASGSPEHIGTAQKGLATVYKPLGDLPRALDLLKRAITTGHSDRTSFPTLRTTITAMPVRTTCLAQLTRPEAIASWPRCISSGASKWPIPSM